MTRPITSAACTKIGLLSEPPYIHAIFCNLHRQSKLEEGMVYVGNLRALSVENSNTNSIQCGAGHCVRWRIEHLVIAFIDADAVYRRSIESSRQRKEAP